jgi:transcriptional regulator with XRE-family HTH domain
MPLSRTIERAMDQLDRNPDDVDVGKRLQRLEDAIGRTGNQMAQLLRIPKQSWSYYKLGQREFPFALARVLKAEFGCSLDWIYLGEGVHNAEAFKKQLAQLDEGRPPKKIRRPPVRSVRKNGENSLS